MLVELIPQIKTDSFLHFDLPQINIQNSVFIRLKTLKLHGVLLVDLTLISLFIPTFFLVSLTPGMCMTLAMTLGMSIGVRKTLPMMWGELIGVAVVAVSSVIGVSALMFQMPILFEILKYGGALYLSYIGLNMFRSRGKLAISEQPSAAQSTSFHALFHQGLITAIANPKGWAFMISLLPPFINKSYALPPQLFVLLLIILMSELICMLMYAAGGKTIGRVLTQKNNVKLLNKVSGTLMILVALWLATS